MVPTDGWTLGAAAVVGVAVFQLVLGRWRDTGPVTVAAGGILVVLALPAPPLAVWIGVAAAAGVAAIAWARGGSRGIGHPSLDAVVLGFGIAVGATLGAIPDGLVRGANVIAATAIGVVGLVAATVALRSPGARHRPVRWVGEIPITEPK